MMKYTPTLLVPLGLLFALAIVSILYLLSDKELNYRYASFDRNFVQHALTITDTLNLKYANYYFAGHTQHTLYLANTKAPAHLAAVDLTLRDTTHYTLRVDTDSLKYRAIRVTVDSPYFYLADGTQPFIYKGRLGEAAIPWITDIRFTKAIPLSASSALLIAIRNYENTVVKKTRGQSPDIYPAVLEEQGEGIFSTDGMLLYHKGTTRMVYVYYYRNEYITFDTSLHTVLRANTIDTISRAKIKTARLRKQNARTLAAPPLKVNNLSAVSSNLLYVQSNLLAKNEAVKNFEQHAVVDVYHPDTQTYLYSFYLPAFNRQKAKEFVCTTNSLYALHETYLVRYHLPGDKKIVQ